MICGLQVVGVGQGLLLSLECGELQSVSFQHCGQDAERVASVDPLAYVQLAVASGGEAVVAG
jgi:hypothetical protein